MIRLIKFGAAWCGPCRVYENILKELKVDHPEVEIKEVNVEDGSDEVTSLIEKYKVQNIPLTIIQYSDGSEVRKVGLISRQDLEQLINDDAKCPS